MNTLWNKYIGLFDGEEKEETLKTFTQEEVNSINADHKRAKREAEEKLETVNGIVKDLQNKHTMSQEEQDKLTTKIEALENANLTAEQKLQKAQEKAEQEYKEKLDSATTDASFWKQEYSSERTKSAILVAAEGDKEHAKAYHPSQVMEILEHKTSINEILDDDDKPTGRFQTIVKGFIDTDTEGKIVSRDLSVDDTVNRMREMSKYANLFHNDQVSGLDILPGTKKSKAKGIDDMSQEEYMEFRKKKKGKGNK